MKKIEKKYKILITVIILILCLTLLSFTLKDRSLTTIEKIIKDTGLQVESLFYKPIYLMEEKMTTIKSNNENEIDKTKEMLIEEQKNTIEELKKILNITYTTEDYTEIAATVIKRNLDNFYNTVILDKGEKDGIEVGMAVQSSGGLIGLISSTSYHTSTVKLLTSSYPISIKIRTPDTEIYGILKEYKDNLYIVQGISENTVIEEGMEVVTTGLGHPIPSGILVGFVLKEERDHFDLNRTIYVTPSIEVDKIHYVKILKRNIE